MNFTELQDAKSKFPVEEILKERKNLYAARNRFIKAFPRERIERMSIDEFIEGKGDTNTFCYGIERTLDGLGRIRGSAAPKFGVYYSKEQETYMFTKKFGTTYKTAFSAIRKELLDLLDAGEKEDLSVLIRNKISPMFKGKILATYYPDRYLNVFDNEHLTHFLRVLNRDSEALVKKDPVLKREALVQFKNEDPEMKTWSLDIFGKFLYQSFPPMMNIAASEESFPTTDQYEFVDLEVNYSKDSSDKKFKGIVKKTDYEKEARKYRKRGDRGEHIVMKAEVERVMSVFGLTASQAKRKVKHVSELSDSYGYDIQSLNDDGTTRYIEVKATTGKVGDMDFYYTQNEYEKALDYKENYYIYIVYEIDTIVPKIWAIKNPFLSGELKMLPVQYKVNLFTK